jgi:hypothetical protein
LPVKPEARAFLVRVLREEAWTRSAEIEARSLGLRNRDALRDRLISLNLPQWGFLKRWFAHYSLVQAAEDGRTFAASALAGGRNPSAVYRSLKEALRMKPGEILDHGGTGLLESILIAELARIQPREDLPDTQDSSLAG